jgi:hypothetical protein
MENSYPRWLSPGIMLDDQFYASGAEDHQDKGYGEYFGADVCHHGHLASPSGRLSAL